MVDPNITAFIDRQRVLLTKERLAEVERSSLLLSNCGPKLLEQKGLSLGGLGVANINIGLGGKTYGHFSFSCVVLFYVWKDRLVELDRPTAYHTSPLFPPHTFRCGSTEGNMISRFIRYVGREILHE